MVDWLPPLLLGFLLSYVILRWRSRESRVERLRAEALAEWHRAHPLEPTVAPGRPVDVGLALDENAQIEMRAAVLWQGLLRDGHFFTVGDDAWDDERLMGLVEEKAAAAGVQVRFDGALRAEHGYFSWALPEHPNMQWRYRRRSRRRHSPVRRTVSP